MKSVQIISKKEIEELVEKSIDKKVKYMEIQIDKLMRKVHDLEVMK